MLPDWWLRFSESSGPAFVSAWSNADVALVAFLVFTAGFALAAAFTAQWLFDVAFASLVAGGILVSWPAMIALTIAAVFVAIVVGALHKWLAPARQARIDAEAEKIARAAAADFERDLGKR
jgi:uncharacterized membrane-anchored protein YitT (DUF2179 family)